MALAGSDSALGYPWHLEQVKYLVGAGVHEVTLIICIGLSTASMGELWVDASFKSTIHFTK
jgi:hypothetical protein